MRYTTIRRLIRTVSIGCTALLLSCADSATNSLATDDVGSGSDVMASDTGQGSVFDFGGGTSDEDIPAGPVSTCASDADCQDGLDCTIDTCADVNGAMQCQWTLSDNACLINNVCVTEGESSAESPCRQCSPESSNTNWTLRIGEPLCDDGDPCTTDDLCEEEGCAGSPLICDDGLECTTDTCVAGECQFTALECDDGNPCTDDTCDETGTCVYADNTAACEDDGDACTVEICSEGVCAAQGALECDDGDICTIDLCDSDVGCVALPTQTPCCAGEVALCNDGDPCTDDLCDEVTGECSTQPNTAPCDDGDLCTINDACFEGQCAGVDNPCDDGNPCTADSCEGGCVHSPLSGDPCDDGLDCSVDDQCQSGVCVADLTECVCEPTFSPVANKVVALQLGVGAEIGQGLNLDGDETTCSPTPCASGIDNALGLVAGLVNEPLKDSVDDGSLVLVIEHIDFPSGDGTYSASLYRAQLAPENLTCDYQTEVCDLLVNQGLYDPVECMPLFTLPTTISGTELTAGGPGTTFPFEIPLTPTASLNITLFNLQLQTTVTVSEGKITTMQGLLGGAVQKADLKSAIANLPEGALPLPPEQIAPLLDTLITNDIDTDGDGVADAASIGITLEAIATNLVGLGDPAEVTP